MLDENKIGMSRRLYFQTEMFVAVSLTIYRARLAIFKMTERFTNETYRH